MFLLGCSQARTDAADNGSAPGQAADSVATAVIPPEGGTVELPGFASVTFPAGVFEESQEVTLLVTSSQSKQELYSEMYPKRGPSLPYVLVIRTGRTAPQGEFEANLDIPAAFLDSLPPNYSVELYAQILGGSPDEVLDDFDRLPSDFDVANRRVRALIPPRAVRPPRLDDKARDTILLIGSFKRRR